MPSSADALAASLQQFLPGLLRWAHGRLPGRARRGMETADLVQEAAIGALRHLEATTEQTPARTVAYLRRSVRNRIIDEIRRADRVAIENAGDELDSESPAPSPLEDTLRADERRHFRRALARLSSADRHLLIGRMELGLSYAALADATGRPSEDAARVATHRAMLRLREELGRDARPAGA